MDDELRDLEAELKQLQPASPSERLRASVAAELSSEPRANVGDTAQRWWWWVLLPAAAAIVALLVHSAALGPALNMRALQSRLPGTTGAETTPLKPISADNVLIS